MRKECNQTNIEKRRRSRKQETEETKRKIDSGTTMFSRVGGGAQLQGRESFHTLTLLKPFVND